MPEFAVSAVPRSLAGRVAAALLVVASPLTTTMLHAADAAPPASNDAQASTPREAASSMNPFDDPFMVATAGRPCPAPLGPAYTERERLAETHSRAERGTSCWLDGRCRLPNAYRYDAQNAVDAVAALRGDAALTSSAIWVTAQRRFVYLEGCVADAVQASRAESVVAALPDVERVIPALALPGEPSPYRLARP